jgi:hypothetical protein
LPGKRRLALTANMTFIRIVSVILIILLVAPFGGIRDAASQQAPDGKYSRDELAQMLAPVALYPDSLLSQVLMASTYPLEIVEADRWVKKNPGLSGDSLDKALQDKTWDVSTKSLCYYPQVLGMLSEQIEWTTKLGDAFLGQQADVMSSVQELRSKALAQGNLETNSQQNVVVEEKAISIEPARQTVVYVPAYNPAVVYGPWLYPAYPPYPYYYPGAVVTGAAISFGAGFVVGAAVAGWSGFYWGHGNVYVNINKTYVFNNRNNYNHDRRLYQNNSWQHNPQHRQGMAYMDKKTAQKYGQAPSRSIEGRRDVRGHVQAQGIKASQAQAQRKDMSQKRAGQRDNAFTGPGSRHSEHAAANRGAYSRSSGGAERNVPHRGSPRGGHMKR